MVDSVTIMNATNIINSQISGNIYTFFGVYLTFVTVFSFLLNALVCYVIYYKSKFSTIQSKIIFSMCIGDAIAPIISYPLSIHANITKEWQFGSSLCSFYGFITFTGGLASIFHIILLSAERYVSIVHPFIANTIIRSKNLNISLVIIWAVAVTISSFPLLGWSRYHLEGIGTSCAVDIFTDSAISKAYSAFIMLTGYAVPMILITYLNLKFLKVVYKITGVGIFGKRKNKTAIHNHRCLEKDGQISKSMSILVTCITVSFNISWLPYAIMSLIGLFGKRDMVNPLTVSIPAYFAKSYTIYDPLIYFVFEKKFRNLLLEIFYCNKTRNKDKLIRNDTSEELRNQLGNEAKQVAITSL